MMWFGIISLFPSMFEALTHYGITGQACQRGQMELEVWNPRDFTQDKHRTVDDRSYGGGPGMVMMAEPLHQAIQAAKQKAAAGTRVVYLSPQGRRFDQNAARALAAQESLIMVAGRYEGVDERILQLAVDEEWSIGDYVLSGGELAAMVMMDAIVRMVPGILGDAQSAELDSFAEGLLDYPHYTRPEIYQGIKVPDVLLSGHHEAIRRYRLKQALGRTWQRRPDLVHNRTLSQEERQLLDEFLKEHKLES